MEKRYLAKILKLENWDQHFVIMFIFLFLYLLILFMSQNEYIFFIQANTESKKKRNHCSNKLQTSLREFWLRFPHQVLLLDRLKPEYQHWSSERSVNSDPSRQPSLIIGSLQFVAGRDMRRGDDLPQLHCSVGKKQAQRDTLNSPLNSRLTQASWFSSKILSLYLTTFVLLPWRFFFFFIFGVKKVNREVRAWTRLLPPFILHQIVFYTNPSRNLHRNATPLVNFHIDVRNGTLTSLQFPTIQCAGLRPIESCL